MKNREFILLGLTLACVLGPFASATVQGSSGDLERIRLAVNKKTLPYTKRLPLVDKVELVEIGEKNEAGGIVTIAATKIIEGKQARTIAHMWRSQAFDLKYSAICHDPPYAIKFYSRGKVVLYASICWECSNIVILEPIVSGQGFNARSRAAKNLLRAFSEALPKPA